MFTALIQSMGIFDLNQIQFEVVQKDKKNMIKLKDEMIVEITA
jgi:hypothetical protein